MIAKNYDKKTEQLKQKIFKTEEKRVYSSVKFKKIEKKVREALKKQNADEALKDITI
jgi:hypothetical protein